MYTPHLPALGWELSTTHQQIHFKGQHKTNNQKILKIRSVRPAFQRTETRKEERKQPV